MNAKDFLSCVRGVDSMIDGYRDVVETEDLAKLGAYTNELADQMIDLKTIIINTIMKIDDPLDRFVLLMYYVEGASWRRIAKALGDTIPSAMRRESFARKKLDALLNGDPE